MKHRYWLWLVLGAAPLLIYPFILMANVMSIAEEPSSNPNPIGLMLTANAFLWGSTLYPLAYVYFAISAVVKARKGDYSAAEKASTWPLLYLVVLAVFFGGWVLTSPGT